MIIALASKMFINKNVSANLNTIIECIKECAAQKVNLLCFGEAFLHGFDGLEWEYETDILTALSTGSEIFSIISDTAEHYGVAVAFGYIENDNEFIYSSYAVIDEKGKLIYNFKRVSIGWKNVCAWENPLYKEGSGFSSFSIMEKKFSVGLCGDFWYDENIEKIQMIDCDLVLWPVFIDEGNDDAKNWGTAGRNEYAEKARQIHKKVLFINSITDEPSPGFGSCIYFEDGKIVCEVAPYTNGLLILHI